MSDVPAFTKSITKMFYLCNSFDGDIRGWNTADVTDMSGVCISLLIFLLWFGELVAFNVRNGSKCQCHWVCIVIYFYFLCTLPTYYTDVWIFQL